MKSMEEMLAAAQQAAETIQKQMGEAQAKLDSVEVEGTSGGGLVKVRATQKAITTTIAMTIRACTTAIDNNLFDASFASRTSCSSTNCHVVPK